MNKKFNVETFRKLREELGFSQNGFARELGVTPETIRNYEHNRSQPAGEVIDKIWRKNTSFLLICILIFTNKAEFYSSKF